MALILTCVFITGLLLGGFIGHLFKPRREVSPRTRKLLGDFAAAISQARITTDLDHPNVLNEKTKALFSALLTRYHEEQSKR